jgi:hypothetical protein
MSVDESVDRAQLRWRIERDYQELKQDLRLGHYEGRGWRGFRHHATLCIAAYGFLGLRTGDDPPRDLAPPRSAKNLPFPPVADPAAPPIRPERQIPKLDRHRPPPPRRRACQDLERFPCCHAPRRPVARKRRL